MGRPDYYITKESLAILSLSGPQPTIGSVITCPIHGHIVRLMSFDWVRDQMLGKVIAWGA